MTTSPDIHLALCIALTAACTSLFWAALGFMASDSSRVRAGNLRWKWRGEHFEANDGAQQYRLYPEDGSAWKVCQKDAGEPERPGVICQDIKVAMWSVRRLIEKNKK